MSLDGTILIVWLAATERLLSGLKPDIFPEYCKNKKSIWDMPFTGSFRNCMKLIRYSAILNRTKKIQRKMEFIGITSFMFTINAKEVLNQETYLEVIDLIKKVLIFFYNEIL